MQQQLPLVTVGMPVFNGAKYIESAISALLAQTYQNFELVIADNCSTDGTEDVCRRLAAGDPRIRYIRHSQNMGSLKNFQFLVDTAAGEYFLWHAADDGCAPNYIESLVEMLKSNPEYAIAGSDVLVIGPQGESVRIDSIPSLRKERVDSRWTWAHLEFFRYYIDNRYVLIYGMYRTDHIKRCNLDCFGKLKWLSSMEIPFLAQVTSFGKAVTIAEPLKHYRIHSDSAFHQEGIRNNPNMFIRHYLNIWTCLLTISIKFQFPTLTRALVLLYLVGSFPIYIARGYRQRLIATPRPSLNSPCG